MSNRYSLNQSPLYCIRSKQKLAKILQASSYSKLKRLTDNRFYKSVFKNGKEFTPPIGELRRVHDRIQNLLVRIKTPDYLHSSVKGRSNISNVLAHSRRHGIIKTDIKSFYPSTHRQKITDFFLIQMRCNSSIANILSELLTYNNFLPKGSPCSTTLAFWVNKNMFDEIETICIASNSNLTVYVDDITISMPGLNRNLLRRINGIIRRNGYLHHKHRVYKSSQPKIITGVVVQNEKTYATKKIHKKLIGASQSSNSTKGLKAYINQVRTENFTS